MAASAKIRILLADQDALRRDGLMAVLSANDHFEVIASAADGETALGEIRRQRPDVAVVDLNLPAMHGIELVRRIRAESIGTKIIVIAGTEDDEIVREVVRAGGDGYLLKNGPARHLVDAIAYVSDGGQYFSPQLRRDGRDRHLLEEPPRNGQFRESVPDAEQEDDRSDRTGRGAVRGRRGRRPARTMSDAMNLRQRIREEASPDLDERDYEIMTRMADGIRPILDRLDEIDTRVAQMEHGDAPIPSDPRGWLSNQLADSLEDRRTGTDMSVIGRSVNNLEAQLPEMIEVAVTRRFHEMAGKLQQEIEETHVRTLETFVKNIQAKLVQRISALEHDMSKQAETMSQLREDSQRTEDNLGRLISGVDKLAQELPRRLAAAAAESGADAQTKGSATDPDPAAPAPKPKNRARQGNRHDRTVKIIWATVPAAILVGLLAWGAFSLGNRNADPNDPAAPPAATAEKFKAPPASADTKTRMQAAQECVDRKDYAVAEDLYKQIVKAEPGNTDALKALASVLYREDKIEESAEILDKLSKN